MKLDVFIVELLDPSIIMVGKYDFYWETFTKVHLHTNSGIILSEKVGHVSASTIEMVKHVSNSSQGCYAPHVKWKIWNPHPIRV